MTMTDNEPVLSQKSIDRYVNLNGVTEQPEGVFSEAAIARYIGAPPPESVGRIDPVRAPYADNDPTKLSQALALAIDTNPSAASQALETARVIGVPPELAYLDPKAAARKMAESGWDPEDFLRKSPLTADLFSNPMVMAAARNDIPYFRRMEELRQQELRQSEARRSGANLFIREPGQWGDWTRDIASGALSMVSVGTTGAGYVASVLTGDPYGEGASGAGFAESMRRAGIVLSGVASGVATPPERRGIANDIATGVGSLAGFAAGGLVGAPLAVTALLGGIGSVEQDLAQQGVSTTDNKSVVIPAGLVSGALDMVGLEAVLGRAVPKRLATNFITRALVAALAEGSTETGQGVVQNLAERAVGLRKEVFDGTVYQGTIGGIVGGVASLAISGMTGRRRMSPHALEETKALVESMRASAELAQNRPKGNQFLQKQHLDALYQDAAIVVSPGPLREFVAAMPLEQREAIEKALPKLAEDLKVNAPVEIRRADYEHYFAPLPKSESLLEHVKNAPLDLTAAEAELYRQGQEAFDRVVELGRAADEEYVAQAKDMAKRAGLKGLDAEFFVDLFRMGQNIASRVGVDKHVLNPLFELLTPKGSASNAPATPDAAPAALPQLDEANHAALLTAVTQRLAKQAGLSAKAATADQDAATLINEALAEGNKGSLPKEIQGALRSLGQKTSRAALREYLKVADQSATAVPVGPGVETLDQLDYYKPRRRDEYEIYDKIEAFVEKNGYEISTNYAATGSVYFEITTPDGKSYAGRIADHGNQSGSRSGWDNYKFMLYPDRGDGMGGGQTFRDLEAFFVKEYGSRPYTKPKGKTNSEKVAEKVESLRKFYSAFGFNLQDHARMRLEEDRKANFRIFSDKIERRAHEVLAEEETPPNQFYQQERGSIEFDSALNRVRVALTNKASATTLAHEMGHYGSLLLRKAAGIAQAQLDSGKRNSGVSEESLQQVVRDWNDLLAWATGKTDATIADMDTAAEERIADGFLVYLQEGVAPTPRLVRIFDKMRIAFMNIIRGEFLSKGLPVSDTVRGIYSRWLLAETDIAYASRGPYDLVKAVSTLFEGNLPKEVAALLNKHGDEAVAAQYAQYVKDYKRRYDAEYREVYEDNLRHFKMEAAQDPEFALVQHITGEVDKQPKLLSRELALDSGVEKALIDLIPARFFGGTNTLDYTSATFSVNGEILFPTVQSVVEALTSDKARIGVDVWAEQQAKEATDAEFPGMSDPSLAEEYAARVVANEGTSQALEAMLLAVDAKADTLKIMRRLAVAKVATMPVKEMRPDRHVAARDSLMREAMRKGTIKKGGDAAVLLSEAYAHNEMARAMTEAKFEAKGYQQKWRKFMLNRADRANRADRKLVAAYDVRILNAARHLLARSGLGAVKPLRDGQTIEDLIRQEVPELEHEFIETIFEYAREQPKDYKQMTIVDVRRLNRAVSYVASLSKAMHDAKEAAKALEAKKWGEQIIAAHAQDFAKEQKAFQGTKDEIQKSQTWFQRTLGLRHFRAKLTRMEHFFHAMNYPGIFTKAMNASSYGHRVLRVYKDRWVSVLNESGFDWGKKVSLSTKELQLSGFGFLNPNARMPVITSQQQLVTLLVNTGSNFRQVVEGYGWDPQLFGAWLERLADQGIITEAHWRMAEKISGLFAEIKPDFFSTVEQEQGALPDEVEVLPVETRWGTMNVGYVPLMYNPLWDRAKLERELGDSDAQTFLENQSLGKDPRFAKTRTDTYSAPIELSISGLLHQHQEMIKYIHIAPTVAELFRIFQQPLVQRAIGAYDSTIIRDMVLPWLAAVRRAVSGQKSKEGKVIDAASRELLRVSGAGRMALNIPNTLSQFTDISSVIPYTSTKALLAATAQYARHAGHMVGEAHKRSVVMQERVNTQIIGDLDNIANIVAGAGKLRQAREWAYANAYVLQRAVQVQMDMIAWHAGYNHATDVLGKSEEEAIAYADSVVTRAFGDTSATGRAALFNDASPFFRLFLQFGDWANNKGNAVYWGTVGELRRRGTRLDHARAIANLVCNQGLVPIVVGTMVMMAAAGQWPTDDDDDGTAMDDIAAKVLWGSLGGAAMAVPFVPGFVQGVANELVEKPMPSSILSPPAASLLTQMARGAAQPLKLLSGEDPDYSTFAKGVMVALSMGLAPQFMALGKPVVGAIEVWERDGRWPETTQEWMALLTQGRAAR